MARGFATAAASCPCPCGSGDTLDHCCGPLHRGERKAATAEALMRSRYSAYALGKLDYLIATHPMPSEAPAQRRRELKQSCHDSRWRGLKVLSTEAGTADDLEGIVRFEAVFSAGGQRFVHRETSLFQRRNGDPEGDWLYIRALD